MEIKSFKKELIQKYSFLTTTEGMETNKVVLVTAIGIIQGTFMLFPDESETSNTITNDLLMAKLTERFAEDYRSDNKIAEDMPLPGNDGGFCLKDVCIKSASATFNLPFLFVFYDQIIAATIGNI